MTTLVNEPKTAVALVVILVAATLLDFFWKRARDRGSAGYSRHTEADSHGT